MTEIKLTRQEETEIDIKLGDDFKRKMTDFGNRIVDLMVEFPMAQGHSRPAQYLQRPFYLLSEAARLCKRFGASEAARDEEDALLKAIPSALDALAESFKGREVPDGGK